MSLIPGAAIVGETMDGMDVDFPTDLGVNGIHKSSDIINTSNGVQNGTDSNSDASVELPIAPQSRYVVEPYQANRRTGYVHDVRMMGHAPTGDHPETPQRIARIFSIMSENNVIQHMTKLSLRPVEKQEALLVHSEDHWDKIEAIQFMNEEQIMDSEKFYEQLSLYVHPLTTLSSKLSCGGVIESCLAVARGEVQNSFAIVRPPGHHAEPDEHMGFCFFNNVAVATRVVQQETSCKRVLILDWDVHHGNGTQRAFYDDPSVLYISLHRYEDGRFYPCGSFGGMSACGEGPGVGKSVNIPWPEKGMRDADYLYAFQKLVMPIAYEFAPELVIISAGFDAADGDELGECHVTPSGYAHMTHMLSSLAGGKLVVALEGGYNLDSVSVSALAVAKILLGSAPPELPPMIASEAGTETVFQCAYIQSRYWKSVDPKECEPQDELGAAAISLPELLQCHRSFYLTKQYQMFEIPFVEERLQRCFASKVYCTQDVFSSETLVLFAHDFGNLRVELQGLMECDVRTENSYLEDASFEIIKWVRQQHMGLIDINLEHRASLLSSATSPLDIAKEALLYLWDNYLELADAKNIVLIAFGTACKAMMSLITKRAVRRKVKAVVQAVGHTAIPLIPRDAPDELRPWYRKVSLVTAPANHSTIQDDNILKRHGNVEPAEETKPIKAFIQKFPRIQEFVQSKIMNAEVERTANQVVAAFSS